MIEFKQMGVDLKVTLKASITDLIRVAMGSKCRSMSGRLTSAL